MPSQEQELKQKLSAEEAARQMLEKAMQQLQEEVRSHFDFLIIFLSLPGIFGINFINNIFVCLCL